MSFNSSWARVLYICYNNSWENCKCCCSSPTGTLCMTKLYLLSWLEAPELRPYSSSWPAVPSLWYPHGLQNMMWHSMQRYPCPRKLLDTELYKAAERSQILRAVQDAMKYCALRGAGTQSTLASYLLAPVSNIKLPKIHVGSTRWWSESERAWENQPMAPPEKWHQI